MTRDEVCEGLRSLIFSEPVDACQVAREALGYISHLEGRLRIADVAYEEVRSELRQVESAARDADAGVLSDE